MAGSGRRSGGTGLARPGLLLLVAAAAVWWWAVLRLVLQPEAAGALESLLAAGGWSLSLLPVHCAAKPAPSGETGSDRIESPPGSGA